MPRSDKELLILTGPRDSRVLDQTVPQPILELVVEKSLTSLLAQTVTAIRSVKKSLQMSDVLGHRLRALLQAMPEILPASIGPHGNEVPEQRQCTPTCLPEESGSTSEELNHEGGQPAAGACRHLPMSSRMQPSPAMVASHRIAQCHRHPRTGPQVEPTRSPTSSR